MLDLFALTGVTLTKNSRFLYFFFQIFRDFSPKIFSWTTVSFVNHPRCITWSALEPLQYPNSDSTKSSLISGKKNIFLKIIMQFLSLRNLFHRWLRAGSCAKVNCRLKVNWNDVAQKKIQFTLLVVNHVFRVNSIAAIKSQL